METFYKFLGGPRTFWGGSNRVIINNYGCTPMFGGIQRPIFVNRNCFGGGLNRMFGFIAGMNLLSNLFGYNNQISNPYMGFYQSNMYNPYALNNQSYNDGSINSRLQNIEKEVKSLQKQVDDIENAKCDCANNNKTVKTDKTDEPAKTDKTDKTTEKNKPEEAKNPQNKEETKPKTIDELLNNIEGFDKLDSTEQKYVKDNILKAYQDQNGNIKYDIKAIVHDGDTIDTIIKRFYSEQEQQELNVVQNEYNAQISGQKVKNPSSGDTINANGVSQFGVKSLMEDSKQKITRDGEIQKTNKKLSELKDAFVKGDKKLSKEYVLQNHLMTESEYNKIIQNKYQ